MISVLFTHTLQSFMEITSEARAVCGSCFLRDAQGGCALRVPGGPRLSLELYSSVVGTGSLCSPRLFTRGPPGWNPGSAPTSSGATSHEALRVPVSLPGLSNWDSITGSETAASGGRPSASVPKALPGAVVLCSGCREAHIPGGGDPSPGTPPPVPLATRQPSPACGALTSSRCYVLLQSIFSDPWVSVSVRCRPQVGMG